MKKVENVNVNENEKRSESNVNEVFDIQGAMSEDDDENENKVNGMMNGKQNQRWTRKWMRRSENEIMKLVRVPFQISITRR